MFNLNDKIKINEELCPENKRAEKKFQFGSLNYIALMLEWEFEVERIFVDEYHGDMVECKVLNVPNIRSNVVLKSADLVLTSKTMLRMDFEILGRVNVYQASIDALKLTEAELISARTTSKSEGKKITDKRLITNWNDIKSTRAKIKKLEDNPETVFSIKHSTGTYTLDCKEEDIPAKLRTIIRNLRRDRKVIKTETKAISGGLSFEKTGGVLTKPGKFLELNEKFAVNVIKEHKKPTTSENYVGIEIEMLSPKSIEEMNKEFIKARLHRFVNIGTDGSVKAEVSEYTAMELRICLPESLLEYKLKEICSVLKVNDCYANRSCGMHVHLDMRNRNPELCYKNFFKVQKIMLDSQPANRRVNKYCKPNTLESVKLKDFKLGGDDGRYQTINTQSYDKNEMRTIEIRVHEGATKFKDIINWVKFLVSTATLTTALPTINTVKELREANYLDESIINHLDTRIEEYSA